MSILRIIHASRDGTDFFLHITDFTCKGFQLPRAGSRTNAMVSDPCPVACKEGGVGGQNSWVGLAEDEHFYQVDSDLHCTTNALGWSRESGQIIGLQGGQGQKEQSGLIGM